MPQSNTIPDVTERVANGPPRNATSYRTGALPNSGAFDPATNWYELPLGVDRLTLAYLYTLVGSATGCARFYPVFKHTDITDKVFRDIEVSAATVGSTTSTRAIKESQFDTPVPSVDTMSDAVIFRIPPGFTHVAFPAAEVGDPSNPGTLAMWILTGV